MKKRDLVNHIEGLKEKVTVDATIKKLCDEISQLSILVTESGKISSQLMVVSNVNTLLVTRVSELEKQQTKRSSMAGETMLRYLVYLIKYQMKI